MSVSMMGKLKDLTMNRDETQNLTITVKSDFREAFDEMCDGEVVLDIKKYNPKRSLDANARAWVLIDQIAEKSGERKTDVYRHAIKEIGGVSDIFCAQDFAVDRFCRNWESQGQGWMTERTPSKIPGCTNIEAWYGSSSYDRKQMSDLIDSLVQEAENLGIPTMQQKEYDKLLEQWGKKVERKKARREKAV